MKITNLSQLKPGEKYYYYHCKIYSDCDYINPDNISSVINNFTVKEYKGKLVSEINKRYEYLGSSRFISRQYINSSSNSSLIKRFQLITDTNNNNFGYRFKNKICRYDTIVSSFPFRIKEPGRKLRGKITKIFSSKRECLEEMLKDLEESRKFLEKQIEKCNNWLRLFPSNILFNEENKYIGYEYDEFSKELMNEVKVGEKIWVSMFINNKINYCDSSLNPTEVKIVDKYSDRKITIDIGEGNEFSLYYTTGFCAPCGIIMGRTKEECEKYSDLYKYHILESYRDGYFSNTIKKIKVKEEKIYKLLEKCL